jgi:hypothetical protein
MSSSFKFEFDQRGLKKAVEKAANKAVKVAAKNAQRVLDRVHRSHAGRPVNDVMARLRSAARSAGWKFTDGELRPYAEAISQGTRVVFKPGRARL